MVLSLATSVAIYSAPTSDMAWLCNSPRSSLIVNCMPFAGFQRDKVPAAAPRDRSGPALCRWLVASTTAPSALWGTISATSVVLQIGPAASFTWVLEDFGSPAGKPLGFLGTDPQTLRPPFGAVRASLSARPLEAEVPSPVSAPELQVCCYAPCRTNPKPSSSYKPKILKGCR